MESRVVVVDSEHGSLPPGTHPAGPAWLTLNSVAGGVRWLRAPAWPAFTLPYAGTLRPRPPSGNSGVNHHVIQHVG